MKSRHFICTHCYGKPIENKTLRYVLFSRSCNYIEAKVNELITTRKIFLKLKTNRTNNKANNHRIYYLMLLIRIQQKQR